MRSHSHRLGLGDRELKTARFPLAMGASPSDMLLSGTAKATDLYRLLYYSDAAPGISREDLQSVLSTAAERNARVGITGALAWDGMHFVQVLEGHRIALADLLDRLYRDTRHRNLVVCDLRRVRQRHFGNWSMIDLSGNGAFTNFSGFQPYAYTPSQLLRHMALALTMVA